MGPGQIKKYLKKILDIQFLLMHLYTWWWKSESSQTARTVVIPDTRSQ